MKLLLPLREIYFTLAKHMEIFCQKKKSKKEKKKR